VASLVQEGHTVSTVEESELLGQQPFKSPAKLTKSHSDIVGKSRLRQLPAARPADDETSDDKGPWSKAEAYLLFDWFPPGRNKLALGNVEEIPAQ
jgi:hypothetical protein